MKKITIFFGAIIFASYILTSCNGNNGNKSSINNETAGLEKDSIKTNDKIEGEQNKVYSDHLNSESNKKDENKIALSESQINAKFKIDLNGNEFNDNPSSNISLSIGGKVINISSITGNAQLFDKSNFADMGIPKNALSACGAFWAGAGDYFYIVPSKSGIIVYQGWQDEEQEDSGYHWKKLKEIAQ